MKRWLLRGLIVLVVAFVAVYGGDWVIFKLRGSPHSKVTVNRYLTIPLKGNTQAGQNACWQLRRHPNQGTTL